MNKTAVLFRIDAKTIKSEQKRPFCSELRPKSLKMNKIGLFVHRRPVGGGLDGVCFRDGDVRGLEWIYGVVEGGAKGRILNGIAR